MQVAIIFVGSQILRSNPERMHQTCLLSQKTVGLFIFALFKYTALYFPDNSLRLLQVAASSRADSLLHRLNPSSQFIDRLAHF